MKKYIYLLFLCFVISGCGIMNQTNTNTGENSTGDILYTGEAYSGLSFDEGYVTGSMLDTGDIIDNLTGNATGLAKTNSVDIYTNPPYAPINGCNWEARKTNFAGKDIYMMVMNCNLEDGKITINASGDTWSEDKYIGGVWTSQVNVIKMFSRQNISTFDELVTNIPKGCVYKKVNEDSLFEQWEIFTTGDYTKIAEQNLVDDDSYLPCGEYGYSAVGRRWFVVPKSYPNIVFAANAGVETPLFETSTISIK